MQSDDKIKGNDKASAHRLTKSAATEKGEGCRRRGEGSSTAHNHVVVQPLYPASVPR